MPKTLDELSEEFAVGPERMRQIENGAMEKREREWESNNSQRITE
jgi:DNA-directed RNA polymerase sigma subunit (sigma70/sigma32)